MTAKIYSLAKAREARNVAGCRSVYRDLLKRNREIERLMKFLKAEHKLNGEIAGRLAEEHPQIAGRRKMK